MDTKSETLDFSGKFLLRLNDIPSGIKLITWARTISWFGWGFGETLLPVFILAFSPTLTGAGLVNSAYDFVFLLSLPIIGLLADIISSKNLLILGLLLYPFTGISYYLAGTTGLILFVILGKAINGASACLNGVGTDTYIRRTASRRGIASAFGYNASLANFGWLIAALIGAYLVRFVPIHFLLFMVAPFALIGLIPLLRAKKDEPSSVTTLTTRSFLKPLLFFLKEVATMRKGLRSVVFLMFTFDVASVAASFFIPIEAYKSGASLSAIAILVVISAIPALSEFWLAEFIDGSRTKRHWALFAALAGLPLLFLAASVASAFSLRILIALGIELSAVFGSLALQSYATVLSRRDRYGEISSVLEGASTMGDLAGPVAIGILTDAVGFSYMFIIAATLFLFIAIVFLRHPIER